MTHNLLNPRIAALIAVLLLIFTTTSFAQSNIRVTVLDSTNKPVKGALVKIDGLLIQDVTNDSGIARLKTYFMGIHTLVASKIGFENGSTRVMLDADTNLTMHLDLSVRDYQARADYIPRVNKTSVSTKFRDNSNGGLSFHGTRGTSNSIRLRSSISRLAISEVNVTSVGGDASKGGYTGGEAWRGRFNTENYNPIVENDFHRSLADPLSTFSIDVDVASYGNVRRFLMSGQAPPPDAVRTEEMMNYFTYDYPEPTGAAPFSITTEMMTCPWDTTNRLVEIALQGKHIAKQELPPSNLVFLIDVSGSMDEPDKLPLVCRAFHLLVNQLRAQDRVAIVTYAGNAGLALPSTPGDQKEQINQVLDRLQAGGSTAGGEGIMLAYKIAKENLMKDGNNRVILATDGDFNVGVSSDGDLVRLMEEKRKDGIYLTLLGVGTENLKDSKMEQIADKGNGNYSYVDNILEAQKVLVTQMGGTLYTIAKDVKIQVEFNPAKVQSYRLIGYEDRMLQNQDFNNDKKDAGELGAGHSVTALYEVVPVGGERRALEETDPLRYQHTIPADGSVTNELLQVKLRYKEPKDSVSKLLTQTVFDGVLAQPSTNIQFASAVAEFSHLLRNSKYAVDASLDHVIAAAEASRGADKEGYRAEFIKLVKLYALLDRKAMN